MKQMLATLLFALPVMAWAQTATITQPITQRGVQLKRGTSNVGTPHATKDLCRQAAVADTLARGASYNYTCNDVEVVSVRFSTTPVPISPVDPVPTPTPAGPVLYFSDCQAGAAATCVPGNDANPGTLAAPKRNPSSVNLNGLAAGTSLLFARGGAWSNFSIQLYNLNATPTAPIVFDAYGAGSLPLIRSSGVAFGFALQYGQSVANGGYMIRNMRIEGGGAGSSGIAASKLTRNLLVENVNISGFQIGLMLHDNTVSFLTLRNSVVQGNTNMGMLGAGNDWTIESNTFENNGDARPPSTHAFYFSASGNNRNLVMRNNTFRNNSQRNGSCSSGNMTLHGTITNALIEGNTIISSSYSPGCRGISITAGYPGQEYMRNFVVRGNSVRNSGACVAFNAAPNILIEGNKCVDNTSNAFALIENPGNGSGGGDDADGGAVIRGNTICGTTASATSLITVSNASVTNNVVRTGADASTGVCTAQ